MTAPFNKAYPRRYKRGRRIGSTAPPLPVKVTQRVRDGRAKRWAAWCRQNARDLHRLLAMATRRQIMGRVGYRWFGRRDKKGEPILPSWAQGRHR